MSDQWNEPAGINPRGTVVVAAGRGETPEVYARFGRRLAADAYRVRVLPDVTADLAASFTAAEKLLGAGESEGADASAGPRVLIGSDTGALFALALAARGTPNLDALILAGLPQTGVGFEPYIEAGIEARTACPNHRRVLSHADALPAAPIPTELIEEAGLWHSGIPVLGLHGGADLISPLAGVRYPAGPVASLSVIEGGRHDILNDVTHRTVAALIVQFLERLKLGADLPLIAKAAA